MVHVRIVYIQARDELANGSIISGNNVSITSQSIDSHFGSLLIDDLRYVPIILAKRNEMPVSSLFAINLHYNERFPPFPDFNTFCPL